MKAEMKEEIFLLYFEVRILTKTQKPIQMFQLGVGLSQMHPSSTVLYPGIRLCL